MNVNKVLEPPLKVGRGNIVVESCSSQLAEHDDGASLNLKRSDEPDEQQQVPTSVLKQKEIIKILTFNMRTGREQWRINEIIHHMNKYDISIIELQEHRRAHEEEIFYEHLNNYLLITSSAWRNSSQAAVGGVGFIMNRKAEKALCDVTYVSNRIMKATFVGNPEFSTLSAYSPTNTRQNQEEADCFYDLIRNTIDETPKHVRNAHDNHTNENGTRPVDLACEKSLCIANTMFENVWENAGLLKTPNEIAINLIIYW